MDIESFISSSLIFADFAGREDFFYGFLESDFFLEGMAFMEVWSGFAFFKPAFCGALTVSVFLGADFVFAAGFFEAVFAALDFVGFAADFFSGALFFAGFLVAISFEKIF